MIMKITVITASYNCASVKSQSFPDIEHIVIDGTSVDATLNILEAHRSQLSLLISESDEGIYDALNKGISLASGEVIGFLHSDDVFSSKDVLKNVASIFEVDSSVSAVYGDLVYVNRSMPDRAVRTWRSSTFLPYFLKQGWMPPHPIICSSRMVRTYWWI